MKKKILGLVAATLSMFALAQGADTANNLSADWQGILTAGSAKLRLVFKITQATDGGLTATLYSIDQGAQPIPVEKVTRDADAIAMQIPLIKGGFKGTLNTAGDTITGEWSQQGNSLPLSITRVGPGSTPFKAEEVAPVDPVASKAAAEKIAGVWNGTLVAGTMNLRLRVKITKTDSGTATGTMDSLDQGANDIPLSGISLKDGTLHFDVRGVGGVYEGTLSADGALLKGEWRQSGQGLPLELKKQ